MLLFQYVMHENKAGFVCRIEHAPLLDQMLQRLRHPEADIRRDSGNGGQIVGREVEGLENDNRSV